MKLHGALSVTLLSSCGYGGLIGRVIYAILDKAQSVQSPPQGTHYYERESSFALLIGNFKRCKINPTQLWFPANILYTPLDRRPVATKL